MDAPAAVLAMVTTVTDHLGGTAAPTSWRRRSILHRSSPLSPLPASIIPLLSTVDTTRLLTATAITARPATAGADAGRPATGTVAVCGDGGDQLRSMLHRREHGGSPTDTPARVRLPSWPRPKNPGFAANSSVDRAGCSDADGLGNPRAGFFSAANVCPRVLP